MPLISLFSDSSFGVHAHQVVHHIFPRAVKTPVGRSLRRIPRSVPTRVPRGFAPTDPPALPRARASVACIVSPHPPIPDARISPHTPTLRVLAYFRHSRSASVSRDPWRGYSAPHAMRPCSACALRCAVPGVFSDPRADPTVWDRFVWHRPRHRLPSCARHIPRLSRRPCIPPSPARLMKPRMRSALAAPLAPVRLRPCADLRGGVPSLGACRISAYPPRRACLMITIK